MCSCLISLDSRCSTPTFWPKLNRPKGVWTGSGCQIVSFGKLQELCDTLRMNKRHLKEKWDGGGGRESQKAQGHLSSWVMAAAASGIRKSSLKSNYLVFHYASVMRKSSILINFLINFSTAIKQIIDFDIKCIQFSLWTWFEYLSNMCSFGHKGTANSLLTQAIAQYHFPQCSSICYLFCADSWTPWGFDWENK